MLLVGTNERPGTPPECVTRNMVMIVMCVRACVWVWVWDALAVMWLHTDQEEDSLVFD